MNNSYSDIICHLFRGLRERYPDANEMPFIKSDLERIAQELGLDIKNIADIKYSFDSRQDFPKEISDTGHWTILGRGKGKYSFVKMNKPNGINIPDDLHGNISLCIDISDSTPSIVRDVIGSDEQATLTKLFYSNVFRNILGLKEIHKVQGHQRTYTSLGQVEVDEVYVGTDGAGETYIIPISAKGGKDKLSYAQAINLVFFARENEKYSSFKVRPLGVSKQDNGDIFIIEFSPDEDINNIRILNTSCVKLSVYDAKANIRSFTSELLEAEKSESASVAIRAIYDSFSARLDLGYFSVCNHLLSTLDVSKFRDESLVAILTITLRMKDALLNRSAFYSNVEKILLEKHGADRCAKILFGLE